MGAGAVKLQNDKTQYKRGPYWLHAILQVSWNHLKNIFRAENKLKSRSFEKVMFGHESGIKMQFCKAFLTE